MKFARFFSIFAARNIAAKELQRFMPDIKYKYAFVDDETDHIICIDEVTAESRHHCKFRCIGCGQEISPRAVGSQYKNRAHFWHVNKEGMDCSSETYLHKLAKHILKKKFDESPTFIIEYAVNKTCDNSDCKYHNSKCEEMHFPNKVDLKEYYDTCKEEAPVEGFIADLLLTNSEKPDRKPTLIEVCVSHKCEEEKRESGLHIIEIKIKDEQDATDLRTTQCICESTSHASKQNVEFINFKKIIKSRHNVELQRYIYNPNERPTGYMTKVDCSRANFKLLPDSEFELNMVSRNLMECTISDALLWMLKYKRIYKCLICKFYWASDPHTPAKCHLSEKCGTPMFPEMNEADRCEHFRRQDKEPAFACCFQKDAFIEEVPYYPQNMT